MKCKFYKQLEETRCMGSIIGKLEICLGFILLLSLTPLPFFNQLVRSGITTLVDFFPLGEMLMFSLTIMAAVAVFGLFLIFIGVTSGIASIIFSLLKIPVLPAFFANITKQIGGLIDFRRSGTPLAEQLTSFYDGLGATAFYIRDALILGLAYMFIVRTLFHVQDFDLGSEVFYFSQLAGPSQPVGLFFTATLGWYLVLAGLGDHGFHPLTWAGRKLKNI